MKIQYTFADGTTSEVEVSEEIGTFILESRRSEENLGRKERYHCYSLDAIGYEGNEYAGPESPEKSILRNEQNEHLQTAMSVLTAVQKSRLELYADGKSFTEIGRLEGVAHKQVAKSIRAAQKKLKKSLK